MLEQAAVQPPGRMTTLLRAAVMGAALVGGPLLAFAPEPVARWVHQWRDYPLETGSFCRLDPPTSSGAVAQRNGGGGEIWPSRSVSGVRSPAAPFPPGATGGFPSSASSAQGEPSPYPAAPRAAADPIPAAHQQPLPPPAGLQEVPKRLAPRSAGVAFAGGAAAADLAWGEAPPVASAVPDRFTVIQQRLRRFGAVYYRLESWDTASPSDRLYRFQCRVEDPRAPGQIEPFEAIRDDPLQAMEAVLALVETWLLGQ